MTAAAAEGAERMKHRQERLSRGWATTVTVLVLPCLLIPAGRICFWFSGVLLTTNLELGRILDAIHAVGIAVILVVVVVLPCSVFYNRLRWKAVPDPWRYCSGCGYDLTGNESGVCPECGEGIREKARP